jgi:NAD+ diphosphatase
LNHATLRAMAAADSDVWPAIDRAAHLRKDIDALEADLRAEGSLLLPVWRDQSLIDGERLAALDLARARALLDVGGELVWLGKLGAAGCFALDVSALPEPLQHPALAQRGEFKDLRFVGGALPAEQAAVALYARGILYWHRRHAHCGACGGTTAAREGGHVRVCRAEACATQHFPRTDPAVIVLVHDGDDCLLGRQRTWPKTMYSTLAGFVEPGETLEQAVAREVEEESGVRVAVDDVRYFRSQPWPFPSSLMVGFTARAQGRELRASDELEDARWFSRAQLRDPRAHGFYVPGRFSLAGQLIEAFLAQP